jgi:hypothetical protein
MPGQHSDTKLKTKPVDADTWADFDKLFGSRGAPRRRVMRMFLEPSGSA